MCEVVVTSHRSKKDLYVPVVNKEIIFRAENYYLTQSKIRQLHRIKHK